jgi:hypothetical protein
MERRRHSRRAPDPDERLARMRMRIGPELTVVNISNVGVLVEGPARLLPGTHLDVHVTGREGRALVRSCVVRAYVWHLRADAVRYRGALAFDRAIDTSAGYGFPGLAVPAAPPAGNGYPPGDAPTAAAGDKRVFT